MKLIAGICFAVIALALSNKKSVLCKLKLNFIKETCDFILLCKEMIRYSRAEVKSICRISVKKFPSLSFLRGIEGKCYGYESEIAEFMMQIGSSDITGQLDMCQRYYDFFKNEYDKKKEELEKESKVYKALGIFAGTAIIVILI